MVPQNAKPGRTRSTFPASGHLRGETTPASDPVGPYRRAPQPLLVSPSGPARNRLFDQHPIPTNPRLRLGPFRQRKRRAGFVERTHPNSRVRLKNHGIRISPPAQNGSAQQQGQDGPNGTADPDRRTCAASKSGQQTAHGKMPHTHTLSRARTAHSFNVRRWTQ